MIVQTLSTPECTALLAKNRLARLACARNGQPYVVPIYYAYADRCLYAFSMPGKKIDWMRENPLVSVQVDEHGQVANGKASSLTAVMKRCRTASATRSSGTARGLS